MNDRAPQEPPQPTHAAIKITTLQANADYLMQRRARIQAEIGDLKREDAELAAICQALDGSKTIPLEQPAETPTEKPENTEQDDA